MHQEPREPPFRWLCNEIADCFFVAVHHVLSDISGASGLTILDKILGGEPIQPHWRTCPIHVWAVRGRKPD
jgi:hypothetical protein